MGLMMFLSIGTLAMFVPITIQGIWYQIKWYKRLLVAVLLTIAGTLGTFILFYIENGTFGGTSFFGAVFFVPIMFIFVAWFAKIRYDVLMDLCAPAECAMLVIMKVQCQLTGCCGGIRMITNGREYIFPSQIAELINALILCVLLLLLSRKVKNKGGVYPRYMVAYGVTRFVLNLFRDGGAAGVLGLPLGNFWSLVSIAIGIVWLIWVRRRTGKEESQ